MSATVTDTSVQAARPAPASGRAIERGFPIGQVSRLAEHESWRKEAHRPIYHIHKWWAQRLGSVFRAMILGALADADADIWEEFYKRHDFRGRVVLDPFMGTRRTFNLETTRGNDENCANSLSGACRRQPAAFFKWG
jgi:putative DNA methylase